MTVISDVLGETSLSWADCLDRLVLHVATEGSLPESGVSPQQTEMAQWLRQQRRIYKANRMPVSQWDRLRAAPDLVSDLFKPRDPLGYEWCTQVEQLVEFVTASGRMPKSSIPEERRLQNFVAAQLRNKRHGSLSAQRAQVLRSLPSPIGDRFMPSRETWQSHAMELLNFVSEKDRLPSNSDAEEKSLAQWVYRQADRFRSGSLSDDKSQLLRVTHPDLAVLFSSKVPGDGKWERQLALFTAHIADHGNLPSRSASDAAEQKMWRWMVTQLTAHRQGKLSDHRLQCLRNSHPLLGTKFQ